MNIQIFGASKSFETKKAERWFKERRIKFQAIDVRKYGMSRGEYIWPLTKPSWTSFSKILLCSTSQLSAMESRPPWATAHKFGSLGPDCPCSLLFGCFLSRASRRV